MVNDSAKVGEGDFVVPRSFETQSEYLMPRFSRDRERGHQIVHLGNDLLGFVRRKDYSAWRFEWFATDPTTANTRVFKTKREAVGRLWSEFRADVKRRRMIGYSVPLAPRNTATSDS
jgi:hypothetical protein